MAPSNAVEQTLREPDKVMQIGGTTIKIFAPEPVSEAEHERRRKEVAKAIARCLQGMQQ